MESKAIIMADLIAGVLIGIQFLVAREQYQLWDRKLLKKLRKRVFDDGSFSIKTMLIPGSLTAIVMLGIILHGTIKDLVQGNLNVVTILLSALSLIGGMLIGISVLIFIVWIHRKVSYFKKFNPTIVVVTAGFIISATSLTLFVIMTGKVSVHVIALIAAFSVGVMLMGVWTGGLKSIQSYLTFKNGVLIRLGLLVFVGSRAFQLIFM